jgi:hypothetical protein
MTDQKDNIDLELDAFFASAKRSVPTPSETLKDKIQQDAQQEAQQWETHAPVQSQQAWWRSLFEDIGGFPSAAGYGTAAIFGLFIGFSAPDWSDLAEQLVQRTTVTEIEFADPFAGLDLSYLEG